MWRYFKAAFWVGADVPGLGRLPVNVLALAGFGILGVAEPSLWIAGAGLEVAFVSWLAFDPRFQRYADSLAGSRSLQSEAAQVSTLVSGLPPDLHDRLLALRRNAARALAIGQTQGFDRSAIESTHASLDRLEWIFLKLLVARNHLTSELGQESGAELAARITGIEQQVSAAASPANPPDPDIVALARSQEATLAILRRRAENLRSRDRLLRENSSDLERIEAQVDLMRENAAIEGKPAAVDTEIELASDLASPDLFGPQSGLVRALDERRSDAPAS